MGELLDIGGGARLAYDDSGKGRPSSSSTACGCRAASSSATGTAGERFRVINVDLRGHGESPASEGGHTVAQYAQDVQTDRHARPRGRRAVGWSMGTFVIWDLVRQFGPGESPVTSTSRRARATQATAGSSAPSRSRSCSGARGGAGRLPRGHGALHPGDVRRRAPRRRARAARRRDAAHRRQRRHLHPARPVAAGLPRVRRDLRRADAARLGRGREGRPAAAGVAGRAQPPPSSSSSSSRGTARCGRSPSASTRSSATGSRRARRSSPAPGSWRRGGGGRAARVRGGRRRELLDALVARRLARRAAGVDHRERRVLRPSAPVDPGVYVPRPQTEQLARRAAERLPRTGVAIDLCTGCGAVAP